MALFFNSSPTLFVSINNCLTIREMLGNGQKDVKKAIIFKYTIAMPLYISKFRLFFNIEMQIIFAADTNFNL